ncbi:MULTISPECIES: Crp/Fnr family transcriptional regulator [Cohaesibacter]|uniref:Crp/Fnr family transcriptional regulator n=1 Tax=Cohaesibacter TaxID=655352 RepID=UPI0018E59EAC|nr:MULTISPECIES: Crp/Fnr family transcriptional regulator [Cohaesibacter]
MLTTSLTPDEIGTLRLAPIFRSLAEETLDELLLSARPRQYARGKTLFVQNEPADCFYVVLEGWVKIFRINPNGEEAVIGVFTRGQSFAEAAAFTGGEFPATGETVTDCRLLRLESARLIATIKKNPEMGLAMLASTSQHLHMLIQQIEQLKAQTGVQRVAEFLLDQTSSRVGSCMVQLPYDKALIAGRLGIKPESLSRAFKRLREHGVDIQQNHAVIDELRALQKLIDKD